MVTIYNQLYIQVVCLSILSNYKPIIIRYYYYHFFGAQLTALQKYPGE